jgi:hypothetical protein
MKAFPWHEGFEKEAGMDLRDYFAAKAMQGMLSNYQWTDDATEISTFAYKYADSMMKAREQ